MVKIRYFEGKDTNEIIDLWNKALPLDGITHNLFERKIILDINREKEGFIVAEEDKKIVGFIFCIVYRRPISTEPIDTTRGFITVMAIHPDYKGQGIGSKLITEAIEFFKKRNRKSITIAPYPINYFVPGIDKERYPDGIKLFQKFGFEEYYEAISMDGIITKFEIPEKVLHKEKELNKQGIKIRQYSRSDLFDYLEFMDEKMPKPWLEDARRNLVALTYGNFEEDSIFLALKDDKIIGYCQYEGEHFGPFGVIDEFQGQGVGSVLLAKTLYQMRLKGGHSAWVLWTGEQAAKGVYARLGMSITRRFAIMKKEL